MNNKQECQQNSINMCLDHSKFSDQGMESIADEKIECESHFILEELGIPYMIVNEQMQPLKWTHSFLRITKINEDQLLYSSLNELGEGNLFISFCTDLIDEVLVSGIKQEDDIELDDFFIQIRAIPISSKQKICLIVEDCSLQKQFDDLLTFHHQLEAASHIAAGVAHELRNPLSVIKGFLQLAKLTDDFNKYYETIMSELNRMNGIIDDFLSVSRKRIERRRQSPMKIMESLTEIMKAECLLHNVEFFIQLMATEKVVYVNESMIKQVMLNLLRNSIEAYGESNKKRMFRIMSIVEGDSYILSVEDNGKGIPESILNQIEKPFFTTKETGTGVGIPLCKRIIEDHGGKFEIKSTYNVGTTVWITLPLV